MALRVAFVQLAPLGVTPFTPPPPTSIHTTSLRPPLSRRVTAPHHTRRHATLPPHPLPSHDDMAATVPRAAIKDDFLSGPSSPPRPRSVYQVVLFSVTTNMLWYGFYKYCVEEDLRRETGHGLGGLLALSPFLIAVCAPLYAPSPELGQAGVAAAFAWIAAVQFSLYRRINDVVTESQGYAPLTPWWLVVPGFNLIVGFRSIHFLAVAWGADPEDDPLVAWFPFLSVHELSIMQLLTTPSLWFRKPS